MNVIYFIRNRVNNKIYIGVTNDLERRFYNHKHLAQRGESGYLYNAMRKYGVENFEIYPLEYVKDRNEAYEKEAEWINDLNLYKGDHGYNMIPGGKKIKSNEDAYWYGVTGKDHPRYGISISKEHKQKISKKCRGEKCGTSKLSKKEVYEIKWLVNNTHKKHRNIAKRYSLEDKSAVSRIDRKVTWSHINKEVEPDSWIPSVKACSKWVYQNTRLSQRQVADLYPVSNSSISRWNNDSKIKPRKPE